MRIAISFLCLLTLLSPSAVGQEPDTELPPLLVEVTGQAVFNLKNGKQVGLSEEDEARVHQLIDEMNLIDHEGSIPGATPENINKLLSARRKDLADEFVRRALADVSPAGRESIIQYLNYRYSRSNPLSESGYDLAVLLSAKIREDLNLTDEQVEQIRQVVDDLKKTYFDPYHRLKDSATEKGKAFRSEIWGMLPMDVEAELRALIGEPLKVDEFSERGTPGGHCIYLKFYDICNNSWSAIGPGTPDGVPLPMSIEHFHYSMLYSEEFHQELELSEQQKEEVSAYVTSLQGGGSYSNRETNQHFVEQLLEGEQELPKFFDELLNEEQKKRCLQIELQFRLGYGESFGLFNPAMETKIELTDDLRQRMEARIGEYKEACQLATQEKKEEDDTLRYQHIISELEVLTEAQRKRYHFLVGDQATKLYSKE